MLIPPDAEIASEKLTHYLLVPKPLDDKSKFLARAGFSPANFQPPFRTSRRTFL